MMGDRDILTPGEERRCSACAHALGFSCTRHATAEGRPRFIAEARQDLSACGPQGTSFAPKGRESGQVIQFPKAGRLA